MKEANTLINANIGNLTSLWKTVAVPFGSYFKTPDFEYCTIKGSEWPNRLWFNQNLTQETMDLTLAKLATVPVNITLPIWNIYDNSDDGILRRNGFKTKFGQIGMSLKPDKLLDIETDIKIKLVTNEHEAKLWSELFIKSFGYVISLETISKTFNEIDYYIAYDHNKAVGTALVHKTNTVLGIHSMGIPPEMRRQGHAENIMKLLINKTIEDGYGLITLQASEMGKNLYLKLGFHEQFLIKNYTLQRPV
ncbi:ribosomal protein S18 acetylase RimI-like enzyme [Saonia flava]|uniref:Ribosomal protein S18 acetylase RimI-like enzyme n=1 Tax=Saonia flava TaxID=523696 RepID=A0A846R627_9FLAO|nr:GNAT family N-acetyltransferase [Saonia flava]NJB72229.1 ribosomal protein S18 acetylase RimI-like enzyme [Saonia flava]